MKQTKNSPLIPYPIQKTLLGLGFVTLLSQVALSIQFLSIAYPGGAGLRLSEWSVYAVSQSMMPLLAFLIAYFLVPKTKTRLQKVFLALMLAIAFTQIGDLLHVVLINMSQLPFFSGAGLFSPWLQIAGRLFVLVLLAATLMIWRTTSPKLTEARYKPILWSVGAAYGVAVIQQILIVIQSTYYGDYSFTSLSITALTVIILAMLILGTFLAIPAEHVRSQRVTKTFVYCLVPIMLFMISNTLFSIFTYATHGLLVQVSEGLIFGILGIILIFYVATLVTLRRKKML